MLSQEEAALGGELKDDAGDNLDDQEMKAESEERSMERSDLESAPKHNEGLDSMWDTKSAEPEDVPAFFQLGCSLMVDSITFIAAADIRTHFRTILSEY